MHTTSTIALPDWPALLPSLQTLDTNARFDHAAAWALRKVEITVPKSLGSPPPAQVQRIKTWMSIEGLQFQVAAEDRSDAQVLLRFTRPA